ncbi:2-hydroxymuconic semialdehyde dehydrogenase [Klugiella xanthotipulae]|uniref:Aminomuconate-semialdehyde/2-hydroxymuconate-6-semialdehyde dehydrogenase n=1 Tax=Klugiella xanthotipulae TaxID=244735 RepID=A0A543HT23_9MICO|nr:2-hydroxymuconic semialdehyde dehydrogenase [Klugiella xanthotipulae]TQM61503.1 aminomuconate-semialdehyde/2-hydroxymuconate-6-semialdehyde dehydrogenase [Klugiella xanthotipulae]
MTSSPAELQNFVAGSFVEGTATFENTNPVDGSLVSLIHEADRGIVDAAVVGARAALNGPWGSSTVAERAALLRRIADGIESRFDEFVTAEVADTGKPLALAEQMDVTRALVNFRTFADIISTAGTESFLTDTAGGGTALNYAVRKPLGVVAIIVPWNLPLLLLTWKVAPALACGNAVVVKPSEDTPSTATLLAEVIRDAGAASGVYNVVHGFGGNSAGQFLTEHPGINGVTFTGASATGSTIMRTVAPRLLPVSFELGGKNAALVFDDCDVERAVEGLTRSVFTNTGQVCLCTERVYIQRGVYKEVVAGLVEKAKGLRLGRPGAEGTTTGPLISDKHRVKVQGAFATALTEGAEVLVGGGVPDLGADLAGGSWIEPTLWAGLDNSASVMRDEIFGPVAGLVPFDTEEEGIHLANDTDYGLAASVWSSNIDRAHRVARRMEVGISWVNTWYLRDLRSPFGGSGLSGIGREGGQHSLNFYTELTNVCVAS